MIKFIEILVSWPRPWKLFHYAYGADQDLICIMGGTRTCTVIFDWIPDEHGHFGSAHAWPKFNGDTTLSEENLGFWLGTCNIVFMKCRDADVWLVVNMDLVYL